MRDDQSSAAGYLWHDFMVDEYTGSCGFALACAVQVLFGWMHPPTFVGLDCCWSPAPPSIARTSAFLFGDSFVSLVVWGCWASALRRVACAVAALRRTSANRCCVVVVHHVCDSMRFPFPVFRGFALMHLFCCSHLVPRVTLILGGASRLLVDVQAMPRPQRTRKPSAHLRFLQGEFAWPRCLAAPTRVCLLRACPAHCTACNRSAKCGCCFDAPRPSCVLAGVVVG